MEGLLRCTLSPGQFSSELSVIVRSFNGRSYSLFAQKEDLEYDETPTDDRPVDGWIRVGILRHDKGLYLIQLPQSTLENGQFLTVTADQLTRIAKRQEVTTAQ